MKQNIVVIAEHSDNHVKSITYEMVAFAKRIQQATTLTINVVIIGSDRGELALEVAKRTGLDVVAVQIPNTISYSSELYCGVLTELFADVLPEYICIAHTTRGSDYGPALAAKLNAACITGIEDVILNDGRLCFGRPLYGGKLTARVCPLAETSILTILPGAFKPDKGYGSAPGNITVKAMRIRVHRSRSLGIKQAESDTAGILEANVIVAAGQGIGGKENLDLIQQLASLFTKSAVAGSRIVCDRGWLEYKSQVGVTGATVSPQLYIACGISGAVQHVVGMRGSDFIVAINRDPNAAIFQVADICIVEDLTTFIPAFIEVYKKAQSDGVSIGKF
jgi:electron transfer flavoprotein alpha subunit